MASLTSAVPVPASPHTASTLTAQAQVLARATFGPTPADFAEIQSLGITGWLDRQLQPFAIPDQTAEAHVAQAVAITSSNAPDTRMLAHAIFSKRQLAWRMVHFLNNHFSTDRIDTAAVSEVAEDDAFFKYCFSRFVDVLKVSATSPAMIDYLNLQSNRATAPNENYARELLELHTLGINGGYTEPDVAEAAKVFTGWTRVNKTTGTLTTSSRFRFVPNYHATGPKSLSLGWSTPGYSGNAGVNEGMALLEFLASHDATAQFFTTKLCRYFVADQPPAGLLARIKRVFIGSGGNLRSTLRAVFLDAEFATTSTARAKVHDGFEYLVNQVRRIGFAMPTSYTQLLTRLRGLGCAPHEFAEPTGYPELGVDWQGAGHALSRWDCSYDLANDLVTGFQVPWTSWFGATPPTTAAAWVQPLVTRLYDDELPSTTVQLLTQFMTVALTSLPANPTWTQVRPTARMLLSLVLRLPEAQLH